MRLPIGAYYITGNLGGCRPRIWPQIGESS
jgi:hypothetical protein